VKCLKMHHDNDKEKFLQKWPLARWHRIISQ
jgi:hypothetical protein